MTIAKPPTNDIDTIMSLDPLDMSKADLDVIIAYHRNQRAAKEAGGGRRAKKDSGPSTKIDLEKLGLKPAAPKLVRRI
jgi:hypothetical protein